MARPAARPAPRGGAPDGAPTRADASLRLVLPISILGSGIVFLDSTIVNVALPSIRAGLHGNLADQQWIVEAYLLTLAALLLAGGALGDSIGRRRVLTLGVAGFGACSAACALAPTAPVLILARGLQGIAGALLVPNALALISERYPESKRAAAIGTWTAGTGVATVIGPLGGGALLGFASWRWIFGVNLLPVAVLLVLLARLPEDRATPQRIDYVGALLVTAGLGGPVFALIEQPSLGWTEPRVLIPLLAGLILFIAFIVWEARAPAPMLPLSLFAQRDFTVGNITTLLLYGALGVATFLIVLYLQQVDGRSPLSAGLSLLPVTIAVFALSRRFGALASRIGPRAFMGGGPIVAAAGIALLSRAAAPVDYLTDLLPGVTVFGLGLAATVAPLTATVLGAVEGPHAGLASGVNNAVARVAGLVAIAAIGAVLSVSFQSRIDGALARQSAAAAGAPSATPATTRAATRAALTAARDHPLELQVDSALSPAERHAVRATLRDASTHAFSIALTIAALLAALGGLISLLGISSRASCRPDGTIPL